MIACKSIKITDKTKEIYEKCKPELLYTCEIFIWILPMIEFHVCDHQKQFF